MKKWFLLLIGLLVLVGCKSENKDKKKNSSEGLEFKLTSTGLGYEVSGIADFSYEGIKLVIPSTYNNLPVTKISNEGFYKCLTLTFVEIPQSILSVGENAFKECINLSEVKIEKDSKLTIIENGAFSSCHSLKSFSIPKKVELISYGSFENCINLKNIEFEKESKLKYFGEYSFFGCKSLTEITIPKNVETLKYMSFAECEKLKTVKFENESNLKVIGWCAFYKCSLLESIYIPNNLEAIGKQAFSECIFLTSIEIPCNVKVINDNAFEKCRNLKSVKFKDESKLVQIGNEVFLSCISLTSINIPDSVTEIGKFAFRGCNSLTIKNIPISITSVGVGAFTGCKLVQYNEFGNCLYLGDKDNPYLVLVTAKDRLITEATISDGTRIIMSGAFSGCDLLPYLFIPDNVIYIDEEAFVFCKSLYLYCEVDSRPKGWNRYFWIGNSERINWGASKK